MAKKYLIETFGCQMNDLDSERIAGNLKRNGMEPAQDISQADVIILNTCSVREKAVQKVYARLGEIRRHNSRGQHPVVGVVGCMAQLEGDEILRKAPFVRVLAGPRKGHVMSDLIERSILTGAQAVDMRKDGDPEPPECNDFVRGNSWRASVTISEGCNRQCAFCVVPLTRGREKTRKSDAILGEIEDLAARGYLEIVLLGQTVNSYVDSSSGNLTFAALLRRIAEIKGLKRIRFMSPHPADFSDELLDVMVSCPPVCNHIHMPVQSGSNGVLRAMRRGYTREHYLEIVGKIRNASRAIALSTDLIVGYPGESETDFRDTLSLVNEVQYDSAFSFKYSPRPNTAALTLPGEVSEEEKRTRLERLQERQKQIQLERNAAYGGRTVEVLVDGRAKSRVRLTGRTSDNKIVNFDGPDILIGQIVPVEIRGFGPNSLKGTWTGLEALKRAGEAT
jgi:tRNA-2-methylthio-N6-dimethylallyladenosine synthase